MMRMCEDAKLKAEDDLASDQEPCDNERERECVCVCVCVCVKERETACSHSQFEQIGGVCKYSHWQ